MTPFKTLTMVSLLCPQTKNLTQKGLGNSQVGLGHRVQPSLCLLCLYSLTLRSTVLGSLDSGFFFPLLSFSQPSFPFFPLPRLLPCTQATPELGSSDPLAQPLSCILETQAHIWLTFFFLTMGLIHVIHTLPAIILNTISNLYSKFHP